MAETTTGTEDCLPEGSLVTVTMEVRIPRAATREQIEEWAEHNIGQTGSISIHNPLYPHEPEAWGSGGVLLTDTGLVGTRHEYGHEAIPGGGRRYNVRYSRTRRSPLNLSTAVEG